MTFPTCVSIVRDVEVGDGGSAPAVADPLPGEGLVHRQVAVGIIFAGAIEAALQQKTTIYILLPFINC